MTDASLRAAAWAAPGKLRLLGGVALHALLGWSAVWLPSATSGASRDWLWSAAGAVVLGGLWLAGARWPAARSASSSLVRCALALCAAASIDFSISAPDRLLSVCSADASWDAQFASLMEHLGAFPVSGAAMVGLVLLEFIGGRVRASFVRAAIAVAAMLAAMSLVMGALPWLARTLQWPWTADALVFSMIFSMLLLHLVPLQPTSTSPNGRQELRNPPHISAQGGALTVPDYIGSFVLHCHILDHEDLGMMEVVAVVDESSGVAHGGAGGHRH